MMKTVIIRSKRKTMSLSVNDRLEAVVRVPYGVPQKQIDLFVAKNAKWLEKAAERKRLQLEKYDISDEKRQELIALAKEYITDRVKYYSDLMGVEPAGVKITGAKKRYGSCNAKNSLCFSYYLMLYPREAVDYVVVHELAHIRQHNHSKAFYDIVEAYLPDYKEREKILKKQ